MAVLELVELSPTLTSPAQKGKPGKQKKESPKGSVPERTQMPPQKKEVDKPKDEKPKVEKPKVEKPKLEKPKAEKPKGFMEGLRKFFKGRGESDQ